MRKANFNKRFASITLALGGLVVAVGYLIRSVAIGLNFQIANFLEINHAMTAWIRSSQISES